MADEDAELLHIDGRTFDIDDLTYAERKQIKRIVKIDLWDEEVDGDWTGFEAVSPDDFVAATVLVFMRRDDPDATVEQALACKPAEVDPPPRPTEPEPVSKPRRSKAKVSGTSGSPS